MLVIFTVGILVLGPLVFWFSTYSTSAHPLHSIGGRFAGTELSEIVPAAVGWILAGRPGMLMNAWDRGCQWAKPFNSCWTTSAPAETQPTALSLSPRGHSVWLTDGCTTSKTQDGLEMPLYSSSGRWVWSESVPRIRRAADPSLRHRPCVGYSYLCPVSLLEPWV